MLLRSKKFHYRASGLIVFVACSCLAMPLLARCGLDGYTVEGVVHPPVNGMAISVSLAPCQNSPAGPVWLRNNLKWHGVDSATGVFELEVLFDPTRKWRIPFWGEICNKRPSLVELMFRRPGEELVYLKKPIERKDIELRRTKSDGGPPWSFRIDIGEIKLAEMKKVNPNR